MPHQAIITGTPVAEDNTMLILNRDLLPQHGPYLEFVALPSMLLHEQEEWPKATDYKRHSFFSLSNELLEALCQMSHNYLFFDAHEFLQFNTPERIHGFASQLLSWTAQVAACPVRHFEEKLDLLTDSTVPEDRRNAENLKSDMVHTLLHLNMQINQVAADKKCLAVVGI